MNDFSKIKLIALDMDGTAMNSQSIITDYSKSIIKQISEKYLLVPATGRGAYNLVEDHIKADNIRYIIAANGALVVDRYEHKTIFNAVIPYDIASSIIAESCFPEGMVYIHCNDEVCTHIFHCQQRNVFDEKYANRFRCNENNKYDEDLAKHIFEGQLDVLKIGVKCNNQEETNRCKKNLRDKYPDVNVFDTDINALEITAKDASKGTSLQKLCMYLKIEQNEVCAIGDNGNDASMLKWAGIGVAMGNAIAQTKKSADMVIGTNDEDGAAKFLDKYLMVR